MRTCKIKGDLKMKLTKKDKALLLLYRAAEERDFPQIEEAADCSTYELCDENCRESIRRISRAEAIARLGRDGFLFALCRSAFH